MKKLIRLTESDIHKIVKESVKRILNEIEFDEKNNNDTDYPDIIIHTTNVMGAGDIYDVSFDELFNWIRNSCKSDGKYIVNLDIYVPEDYVNENYYDYLEKYFDEKYYYGYLVYPNKRYILINSESLDDLANNKCSIYFGRKNNKWFKLSNILKLH